MQLAEMSEMFDVFYNNITSNQAPGLNEHEKSLFLTKAEKEITLNHFTPNSKGNNLGQGFDDSAKRQADFSVLMKVATCATAALGGNNSIVVKEYICTSGDKTQTLRNPQISFVKDGASYDVPVNASPYNINNADGVKTIKVPIVGEPDDIVTVLGFPFNDPSTYEDPDMKIAVSQETKVFNSSRINGKSKVYAFPNDSFIEINESIITNDGRELQVIPLRYDEYTRQMSKPYKYPLKNQAWRLMNSGEVVGNDPVRYVEIITNPWDVINTYNVRYVRAPKPIILVNLPDGLTIDGISEATPCELDPILHEEIVQRAVELAKIAWQGDIQTTIAAGQRSE
jgi:hypothetical protein